MRLFYFDMVGRAESIKLLLHHARVPFEDVKIKAQDWPKYKDKFELKQVPVLEDGGKMYCQSIAIMEYLGAKYGYLPKKNFHKLYEVIHTIRTLEDVYQKAFLVVSQRSPLDEKAKTEAMQRLLDVEGPIFVGALERQLKSNSTQEFIVGDSYTIADFSILGVYRGIQANPDLKSAFANRLEEKYPTLWKYAERRMKDFNPECGLCKNKLYYFDIPGRAEMIRLALKHLKIPFEDVRIKFEDWPKEKVSGKFELEQLPTFECEPCGLRLSQSDAIMHYISARHGLLPLEDPEKLHKVLWWCNSAKDLTESCFKVFLPVSKEKKKEMMEKFFATSAKTILKAMEERLKSNKSREYLVGSKNTMADFYFLGTWKASVEDPHFPQFKGIIVECPTLCDYVKKKSESI
eukprot:TRINITY_DN7101_c0_g1_i1.p1 TRINITY_DN7101_c0_g1~~TRINITY_DN7101_c0_g1_i1.p1  ORF type:complete len:404 (+),score=157.58 TRINITY_DN7101_c0_g1_i1:128-1339(+)